MKAHGKRLVIAAIAVVLLFSLVVPSSTAASEYETDGSLEQWRSAVLGALMTGGPTCQQAARFIIANDVQILFRPQANGAMWWVDGNIYLNANAYSPQTTPTYPYMLALIVHEAKHLDQGSIVALSVYGEHEAWLAHFQAYLELTGHGPGRSEANRSAWEELSRIPLSYSRRDLRRVAQLMEEIGGPTYSTDMLPLWPLPQEIRRTHALEIGFGPTP